MDAYRDDPNRPNDDERVVKFRIPLELHLRLHQERLLGHHSISSTVEAALERYLDREMPGGGQHN